MRIWMLVEHSTGERQYCHYLDDGYGLIIFENFHLMSEGSFLEGVTLGNIKILEESIPHDNVITYLYNQIKNRQRVA